ncbi:unnamed protein product [Hymenolepis diminuta]|uniref:Uncharacterized protein n=1 Tax=Hymenolepis diminuta TaxID=6216 RepID=A0A564YAU2_HYMDI|nr:unnamed protein product [Hymenolepis diminuta]
MFTEGTVSVEGEIATKSAPRFIIIIIIIRIRVLSLRLQLRRRIIFERSVDFGLLDLTCSSFIASNHIRVGNEGLKIIVFIHEMM